MSLENVNRMLQNVGTVQFHSQRHSVISTRIASEDDKKWIEEKKYSPYAFVTLCFHRKQERTIERILEDMDKLIKIYSLDEFIPIVFLSKSCHVASETANAIRKPPGPNRLVQKPAEASLF